MDTTIILHDSIKEIESSFDIAKYGNSRELLTAIEIIFGGSIEDIRSITVIDYAGFPETIFKQGAEFSHMLRDLVNYSHAINEIPDYQEDAFKVFFEDKGGNPIEVVKDFDNRYAGEFDNTYGFAIDIAEACGMRFEGNESFFDFHGFGESILEYDYTVLQERFYFRN